MYNKKILVFTKKSIKRGVLLLPIHLFIFYYLFGCFFDLCKQSKGSTLQVKRDREVYFRGLVMDNFTVKHPVPVGSIQMDRWILPPLLPITRLMPHTLEDLDQFGVSESREDRPILNLLLVVRMEIYEEMIELLKCASGLSSNTTYIPTQSGGGGGNNNDATEKKFSRQIKNCFIKHKIYLGLLTLLKENLSRLDRLYARDLNGNGGSNNNNHKKNITPFYELAWVSSFAPTQIDTLFWSREKSMVLYNMVPLQFEMALRHHRKESYKIESPLAMSPGDITEEVEKRLNDSLFRNVRLFIYNHFILHTSSKTSNSDNSVNVTESNQGSRAGDVKKKQGNSGRTSELSIDDLAAFLDGIVNKNNNNNDNDNLIQLDDDIDDTQSSPNQQESSEERDNKDDARDFDLLQQKVGSILPNQNTWRILYDFAGLMYNEWCVLRCHIPNRMPFHTAINTLFNIFPIDQKGEIQVDEHGNGVDGKSWNIEYLETICHKLREMAFKCGEIKNELREVIKVTCDDNGVDKNSEDVQGKGLKQIYPGTLLHVLKYCIQGWVLFKLIRAILLICMQYHHSIFKERKQIDVLLEEIKIILSSCRDSGLSEYMANGGGGGNNDEKRDNKVSMQSDSNPKLIDFIFNSCQIVDINKETDFSTNPLYKYRPNGRFTSDFIKSERYTQFVRNDGGGMYQNNNVVATVGGNTPFEIYMICWKIQIWNTHLRFELDNMVIVKLLNWIKLMWTKFIASGSTIEHILYSSTLHYDGSTDDNTTILSTDADVGTTKTNFYYDDPSTMELEVKEKLAFCNGKKAFLLKSVDMRLLAAAAEEHKSIIEKSNIMVRYAKSTTQ